MAAYTDSDNRSEVVLKKTKQKYHKVEVRQWERLYRDGEDGLNTSAKNECQKISVSYDNTSLIQ